MAKKKLPLKEISIDELFITGEKSVYEVPIYQRNYAWERDEISTLIQDVYDAYKKDGNTPYYIGTLVTFNKGDRVYEVIDGQQRLTTIRLILTALREPLTSKLTFRARRKSDKTLGSLPEFISEDNDTGIQDGYKYVVSSLKEIIPDEDIDGFKRFFEDNVHIIHYQVPKDIELNHYFEVMNSRGEQLEKHEIVKAKLMQRLSQADGSMFNKIWESCSEMGVYIQQNLDCFKTEDIFGNSLDDFIPVDYRDLFRMYKDAKKSDDSTDSFMSIKKILNFKENTDIYQSESAKKDTFQPIIDFPNFLLIVLKVFMMGDPDFDPVSFQLDDKELLNEFDNSKFTETDVKNFIFILLKAKYYLDNYVVHHSREEDSIESNPWKLQVWHKDPVSKKGMLRNLYEDKRLQDRMTNLLSMFEVSFTARQRKNYLFYCLFYLLNNAETNKKKYALFADRLAKRYFVSVYMDPEKLNARNTPLPGSFDEVVLKDGEFNYSKYPIRTESDFENIYGDGITASRGIPLYVFNYLDYKLWSIYDLELRGEKLKETSRERKAFFSVLGCGDFGLKVFEQFYFSRTRRSLEHYYPQAAVNGEDGSLNRDQINCLGNYAMIGSEANSSGSNWTPKTKLDHYLDSSRKINPISVASLKFRIMMQICKDDSKWDFEEIMGHQSKMLSILLDNEI